MSTTEKKTLKVGDLVTFQSISVNVKKNQIGMVVSDTVYNVFENECFSNVKWYIVQFGTMRLVVSTDMVKKIE